MSDTDFSHSDLRNLRIEDSELTNCIFDGASLLELVTQSTKFNECKFRRADLRMARIGYSGTDFRGCTFDGVKAARIGFLNAVFAQVSFRARDWNHTDFRASGFWNCSFSGTLRDITFRGDYLIPSHREISGPPRRTGLHNVSFENAELHWVGFYNGCELENITLPMDGSAFQCNIRDLIVAYSDCAWEAAEYEVLTKYLGIIRPNALEQFEKIIAKNDLIEVGGEETGELLYDRLKMKLAR